VLALKIVRRRAATTVCARGTEADVSFDQATEYEKLAESCLKQCDDSADPDERRLWIALAVELLRLAAAARERGE
jgi:hypothetical protein